MSMIACESIITALPWRVSAPSMSHFVHMCPKSTIEPGKSFENYRLCIVLVIFLLKSQNRSRSRLLHARRQSGARAAFFSANAIAHFAPSLSLLSMPGMKKEGKEARTKGGVTFRDPKYVSKIYCLLRSNFCRTNRTKSL